MNRPTSYRVPAGRVVGLADLRARMATANDLAYHLELTSDTEDFAKVMEALHEAYWIAAALASRSSRTGCREHPHGPVDPEAPDGWGVCLLCNSRRRIGQAKAREIHGQPLTGATAEINRPRRAVETAREPSPPEAAAWREPAEQHPPVLDSPILANRRTGQDHTHAAALARARHEKAARKTAAEGEGR
jgi:hypothetical protein